VARASLVGLQLAAQPGHVEPKVVRALLESRSPDGGEKVGGADELAGAAEEDLQDAPFCRGEPERTLAAGHGVRGDVHEPRPDRDRGGIWQGAEVVAAKRGAQPGEQLCHPERLRHVVIGAHVERADLVAR
jgi:hypothetical protein